MPQKLYHLPKVPGITKKTARFLKLKSLKYLLAHDENHLIRRYFLKHPIRYTLNLLKSSLKKKSYTRDDDFFLYGLKSVEEFRALRQKDKTLFVIGFSYCHKPFDCPSKRFTPECIHDARHPVCQDCFILQCFEALPKDRTIALIIPTIHYIGEKIFEIVEAHPDDEILFLITACELTLEMFGNWGNMVGVRGIGVRLDGRICNTMKAFELSEKGIKPGLTVVLDRTQQRILDLLRSR
jgi:hypothetical protein